MGAPMEVENPGFADRLREALDVPVTTALGAGAASLRALGVRRAVLLTPFDERLKGMLRDHLAGVGIDAVLPTDAFASVADAMRATPEEVYRLAVDAVAAADGVEAVYFQGAPLNPIAVIERIESDLGIPVVASNPAMLWRLASLLGHTFSVPNAGRLLREWPASA
jgi:maleate isomerase